MTTADVKCEAKVDTKLKDRLELLNDFMRADNGEMEEKELDEFRNNHGKFNEFGLSFDWVYPDTFDDQKEGFFRYQLSWGGPSDEFRFCVNPDLSIHRIEYWYMDWFDGASRTLAGKDFELLETIFQYFDPIIPEEDQS